MNKREKKEWKQTLKDLKKFKKYIGFTAKSYNSLMFEWVHVGVGGGVETNSLELNVQPGAFMQE